MESEVTEIERRFDDLLLQEEFDEAHRLIEKALITSPDDPRLFALEGSLFETKGQLKEALTSFENASRLAPDNADFLYWCCEINLMLYRVDEAGTLCGKGIELFPKDHRFSMVGADARLWSIPVLSFSGEKRDEALAAAKKLLDRALALAPDDGEIKVVEATLHLQNKDEAKCRQSFEKALKLGLELFGDYVDIRLCLAILYIRAGKMKKAQKHIDEALALFSEWKDPHYLKLMLFQEHLLMLKEVYFGEKGIQGRMESFFVEHERLLAKGMRVHFLSKGLREGVLEFIRKRNHGDVRGAADTLKEILKYFEGKLPLCIIFHTIKRPSLETLLNIYLGDMYRDSGDSEKAGESYQAALLRSPGDPAVKLRMGKP